MSQHTHHLRSLLSRSCSITLGVTLLGAACSDKPASIPDSPGVTADLGSGSADLSQAPLPPNTKLLHLVSSDYTIVPGTEGYQCQRVTVDRDLYVLKITPISPLGVHHEVLAIDPSNAPDGQTRCGPLETTWRPLFASGVGSPSLQMPEGVALKIPAGSKIVLDLHLFNAQQKQINGTAALDIVASEVDNGYQIATVPFIGPIGFTIGPSLTAAGKCTLSNDTTFFAVFPHMHTTGKHIKIAAGKTGTETVVWDDDYNFNEQQFGIFPDWRGPEKVVLKKGDKIGVTCTYDTTGQGKRFGDSTNDEMCFAISYVTPEIKTTGGTAICLGL